MLSHTLNKLTHKKGAYYIFAILVANAIWVTITTEIKIIGQGYRRNLFSVPNFNCNH
jgi:hypothetical protein